ncbi:5'-3' exonuclease H3TH domain-containing protein [Paenibacillus sp. GCM10012306]|uniref:5'-3' exonuclease n=1 Tax=Paenibacillus sp. GCM10012306 TaxID=3317342 RepID=UPI003612E9C7
MINFSFEKNNPCDRLYNDGYKSNRAEPPLELIPQFDLVKEVVAELGVPNVGLVGYEADDCIGTLAAGYGEESEVYIITGDHDMLQLVTDNVKVVIMKKGRSNYKVYDPAELLEDKGLTPAQVIDLKGFMGDTSDNYPGVRGIGEKTALKLLTDYGTVEGVIENLQLLPKGVRAKIEADLDMLHLSRELAEIRCDVPVVCTLDECLWALQHESAARKFKELEFGSLMHLIAEIQEEEGIVQIELGDLG